MDMKTQTAVTGYRQLTQEQIDLVNEGKTIAEQVGAYVEKLRKHADVSRAALPGQLAPALDQRWVSIGATDLQRGFMAVFRGINQPTTF